MVSGGSGNDRSRRWTCLSPWSLPHSLYQPPSRYCGSDRTKTDDDDFDTDGRHIVYESDQKDETLEFFDSTITPRAWRLTEIMCVNSGGCSATADFSSS